MCVCVCVCVHVCACACFPVHVTHLPIDHSVPHSAGVSMPTQPVARQKMRRTRLVSDQRDHCFTLLLVLSSMFSKWHTVHAQITLPYSTGSHPFQMKPQSPVRWAQVYLHHSSCSKGIINVLSTVYYWTLLIRLNMHITTLLQLSTIVRLHSYYYHLKWQLFQPCNLPLANNLN